MQDSGNVISVPMARHTGNLQNEETEQRLEEKSTVAATRSTECKQNRKAIGPHGT